MANRIGPTFAAELTAAGCPLDGLSWSVADGTLLASTSDTQAALYAQVLAAHDPAKQMPAVPEVISDRQCFQQLVVLGKITQDEALAAVTVGALPKAVTDGITGLPAAQQFPARMLLCGATEFHRSHAMVPVFLSFFGLDGTTDRDALWTAAAVL